MNEFYDDLAATANELLTEFGGPVVLSRTSAGDYDPATGTTIGGTTTTYNGVAAKFDYAQTDIDGTLIRVGDQRVLISVAGVVLPQTGDTLSFTDPNTLAVTVFDVIMAKQVNPAGTAVLYDVQVRGLA